MTAASYLPIEFEPNLDEKLDLLVAKIINRIRFEPSEAHQEIHSALSSAKLSLQREGTYEINAYSTRRSGDGDAFISVGRGLYSFMLQYASCAAAYFISSDPTGTRPSSIWPSARDSMAVALNMLAIPDTVPPRSEIPLSKHQAERALIFGNYAFRFVICHELAHIALNHIDPKLLEDRVIGGDVLATLVESQDMELAADGLGFSLHTKSLDSELLVVTALATAVYFLHASYLTRLRLMLLARLVDEKEWKIQWAHPPALQRLVQLSILAGSRYGEGAREGLVKLNGDLDLLDGEIRSAADCCRAGVLSEAREVIRSAISCVSRDGRQRAVSERLALHIGQLYERSPIGLAEAFDEMAEIASPSDSLALQRLMDALPKTLNRFLRLSRQNRSRRSLLKPLLEENAESPSE